MSYRTSVTLPPDIEKCVKREAKVKAISIADVIRMRLADSYNRDAQKFNVTLETQSDLTLATERGIE